ncbi:GNAT family N-acetyltransferase [Photobacterium sp. CCB-ST2H9]|uniref:GNAT family N-acetyltransferase n=1 Tax=Photobacterium sp. CCB-ST2H9 TaxID=2912855 RepID=UPI002002F51F|nr:GNAT family N-acetyltransferase [Photobacterium sp. CCB-ST2H9]UTM56101.1 GNAT family N-acetyltransferase [Photobacterium sp. CCB-ST2H9]
MIETKKLLLRQFEPTDREYTIALLKNPEFMVCSPTGAMTNEQAECRFQKLLTAYEQCGVGKLALVEKLSGELIGYCGIETFQHQGNDVVELGYRIRTQSRGKGYAFEASTAVLSYAKQMGCPSVWALTESENAPSMHILLQLGFQPRGSGLFENMPVNYFEKCL